jgi:hypothetical protein
MTSPSRDEFMAQLRGSTKVDFLSAVHGNVLVMSKDAAFVAALEAKDGAHARWYDRTEFSTRKGEAPNMQAEVLLSPRFFGEEIDEPSAGS